MPIELGLITAATVPTRAIISLSIQVCRETCIAMGGALTPPIPLISCHELADLVSQDVWLRFNTESAGMQMRLSPWV